MKKENGGSLYECEIFVQTAYQAMSWFFFRIMSGYFFQWPITDIGFLIFQLINIVAFLPWIQNIFYTFLLEPEKINYYFLTRSVDLWLNIFKLRFFSLSFKIHVSVFGFKNHYRLRYFVWQGTLASSRLWYCLRVLALVHPSSRILFFTFFARRYYGLSFKLAS